MPEFLNNEALSMVFDAVLILSVVGLWILWWQQVQQRKHIESMLIEASTELQEATQLLNQALQKIHDLRESGSGEVKARKSDEDLGKEAFRESMKMQVESRENSQSTANISQVSQMLRLQREGLSPDKISKKLQMPLAQIKLMLMLQSNPRL